MIKWRSDEQSTMRGMLGTGCSKWRRQRNDRDELDPTPKFNSPGDPHRSGKILMHRSDVPGNQSARRRRASAEAFFDQDSLRCYKSRAKNIRWNLIHDGQNQDVGFCPSLRVHVSCCRYKHLYGSSGACKKIYPTWVTFGGVLKEMRHSLQQGALEEQGVVALLWSVKVSH